MPCGGNGHEPLEPAAGPKGPLGPPAGANGPLWLLGGARGPLGPVNGPLGCPNGPLGAVAGGEERTPRVWSIMSSDGSTPETLGVGRGALGSNAKRHSPQR